MNNLSLGNDQIFNISILKSKGFFSRLTCDIALSWKKSKRICSLPDVNKYTTNMDNFIYLRL